MAMNFEFGICYKLQTSYVRQTALLLPPSKLLPYHSFTTSWGTSKRVWSKGAVRVLVWSFLIQICFSTVCSQYHHSGLKHTGWCGYCCLVSSCWLANWCIFWEVQDHKGLYSVDLPRECFELSVSSHPSLPPSEHWCTEVYTFQQLLCMYVSLLEHQVWS